MLPLAHGLCDNPCPWKFETFCNNDPFAYEDFPQILNCIRRAWRDTVERLRADSFGRRVPLFALRMHQSKRSSRSGDNLQPTRTKRGAAASSWLQQSPESFHGDRRLNGWRFEGTTAVQPSVFCAKPSRPSVIHALTTPEYRSSCKNYHTFFPSTRAL